MELQLRVIESHTDADRKETAHALLRLLYPTGSFGDMLTSTSPEGLYGVGYCVESAIMSLDCERFPACVLDAMHTLSW